jgi:predicted dehydrogenase
MTASVPIPVVLVGAGNRAREFYAPLLTQTLADRFDLLGVVSRSEGRARALADDLGVPWSLDLAEGIGWGARGAVVAVSPDQNHRVASQLVHLGIPALLETPLALGVEEAGELLEVIGRSGLPFEMAEQNPRHLGSRLWAEVVRRGLLGEVRLVSSGGAGYRYHATAVARQLYGRRRGLTALGMREFTQLDLGRGVDREPLYVGSVDVEGGGMFQLRASEVFYAPGSGWSPLGWSILGDLGGVSVDNELSLAGVDGVRRYPVEWLSGPQDSGGGVRGVRIAGGPDIQIDSALSGFEASDDLQAVGLCLLDWLRRLDGRDSVTAWSPQDAFSDLAWIDAVERSAMLGGVRLSVRVPPTG